MQTPVILSEHPLVQHKMALLRDKNTKGKDFKQLVSELAMLLCYEATRTLDTKPQQVQTPLAETTVQVLATGSPVLVPILRAGLGMLDGMLAVMPAAKVGHIGLYRDHDTLKAVEYYCKLPSDIAQRDVFLLDPMLATGGSAVDAVALLKRNGAVNIKLISIVAAPQGLQRIQASCPDVQIFVAALDEGLNEHGYILPGLGDAGDRIFGTN